MQSSVKRVASKATVVLIRLSDRAWAWWRNLPRYYDVSTYLVGLSLLISPTFALRTTAEFLKTSAAIIAALFVQDPAAVLCVAAVFTGVAVFVDRQLG